MAPLLLALSLLLSGCASLLIRDDDPASAVVAKVVWRTILGIPTLGLGEIALADLREDQARSSTVEERLIRYEERLTFLVNNGALGQAQAEDLYLQYAALLLEDDRERTQPQVEVVATTTEILMFPAPTAGARSWNSSRSRSYGWSTGRSSFALPRIHMPRTHIPKIRLPRAHIPKVRAYSSSGRRGRR